MLWMLIESVGLMRKLEEKLRAVGLSPKEVPVATGVALGFSNAEIAFEIGISEKTVKYHNTNIFRKLGIKNRAQLIVWASPYVTRADIQFHSRLSHNKLPL